MRLALRIGLFIGLSVFIALILREGAGAILTALARAGFVLLWLVPLRALALLLDVMGWRVLFPARPPVASLWLIAAIREAINRLLPVASIGGEIVGIRLLTVSGVDGSIAAASVTVEILLTLVSQYLFVATGLLCLLSVTGTLQHLSADIWLALAAGLPVIVLFGLLLRHGSIFGSLESMAHRFLGPGIVGPTLSAQALRLDIAIRELCDAPGRLLSTIAWQLSGFALGATENWLVLFWLGHPLGFGAAIALESLTLAARSIIFLIPGGLGVQEIGLIGLGRILGLDSDTALALSLAKRVREILFCLPGLLIWQWVEIRAPKQRFVSR
jgi:putative membrane protein